MRQGSRVHQGWFDLGSGQGKDGEEKKASLDRRKKRCEQAESEMGNDFHRFWTT